MTSAMVHKVQGPRKKGSRCSKMAAPLRHAYDQWTVLGLLSYRFLRAPLFVSASYSLVDQTGMTNLLRQVVMLSVTGDFSWGPGTPPLFGGGGL